MNGNVYSAALGALIGFVIGGAIADPVNEALQILVGVATVGAALGGGYAALTGDTAKRMTRFGLMGGAVGIGIGAGILLLDAIFD